MADTLFDAEPYAVEVPARSKLSEQRKRTIRQTAAIANGVHPLGLVLKAPIRMHPEAPRDRTGPGPRCGSCWYRRLVYTNGNRKWPKCTFGAENDTDRVRGRLPRVTHGTGTDVRAHWPACVNYSPGDRLSDDAARYVPGAEPYADPSTLSHATTAAVPAAGEEPTW